MSGYNVQGAGSTFYVLKDGSEVCGPFYKWYEADAAKDRMIRKDKQRKRPCLRCRKEFTSEGPHNRLCDQCRQVANDMGMVV